MNSRHDIELVSSTASLLKKHQAPDCDSEDEDTHDDEFIEELLSATLWGDLKKSVYQARFIAPILAILGIIFSYQLTVAPYRTDNVGAVTSSDVKDLSGIRPLPSAETLKQIQWIMLRQDNQIEMPEPFGGSFNMRFVATVDKHGTHDLPDMFYEGVMFGISHGNSHKVEYSRLQPDLSYDTLYNDLSNMQPAPTYIMHRKATCNSTDWTERGFGVYFSYADLKKQGMLSSDKLQPWKRVYEDILWTARKHKQIYVMVWYPHRFGEKEESPGSVSKHKHENIIQMVIPTRTGMDGLKSTAAVWLMARNESAATIPPKMVRLSERTSITEDKYVSADSL